MKKEKKGRKKRLRRAIFIEILRQHTKGSVTLPRRGPTKAIRPKPPDGTTDYPAYQPEGVTHSLFRICQTDTVNSPKHRTNGRLDSTSRQCDGSLKEVRRNRHYWPSSLMYIHKRDIEAYASSWYPHGVQKPRNDNDMMPNRCTVIIWYWHAIVPIRSIC